MYIFQVSQEDLDRYDTFESHDLGKWCFIVNGTYQGFFDSRDEALESAIQAEVSS